MSNSKKESQNERKGFSLLTDSAIGESEATRKDGLGFEAYASVLADAAIGTPGPFTIGIFGEWGTCKTSLMRLIEDQLDGVENVVTVWFNAWQYEADENPIVPLVGTIIQELERHKTFLDTLDGVGKDLVRALRAVVYGLSARTEIQIPGFAKLEAGIVAKDMIDRGDTLSRDPLIGRSLYYNAFEALAAAPLPGSARVVVLIDDLDRCFPDKAIRLLESIKLVLAQRGFIFVLGVARRILEGYLKHRYEQDYGLAHFDGGSYLDKIVQLAFPLPSHSGRMKDLAEKLLQDVDAADRKHFRDVVPIIAEHLGGNPRALVRFVNNVLIDVRISRTLHASGPGIPPEFFAVTRCLQLRWRDFFEQTALDRDSSDYVAAADRAKWVDDSKDDDSPYQFLARLLSHSPELASLVATESCIRWLKNHEVREQAVLFLQATQRTSEQGEIGTENMVIYVLEDAAIIPSDLRKSMHRLNIEFKGQYVFVGFSDNIAADIVARKPSTIVIFVSDRADFETIENVRGSLDIGSHRYSIISFSDSGEILSELRATLRESLRSNWLHQVP